MSKIETNPDYGDRLPPTLQLGEIVLRTDRYEAMKRWYRHVLQIDPYFERAVAEAPPSRQSGEEGWASRIRLCFFRLVFEHPYQQVVALFEVSGTTERASASAGLHHMQLRDASPAHLSRRCRLLAGLGIVPHRAMDHGPTTSCYYRDPDGNVVEIAVANHENVAQYVAAGQSGEYRRNPSGRPLDMDWFLREPDA